MLKFRNVYCKGRSRHPKTRSGSIKWTLKDCTTSPYRYERLHMRRDACSPHCAVPPHLYSHQRQRPPPPLTPPIFLPSSAFNWISFFVPIPRLRINSIVHGRVAHRRDHPLRRQLLEFSITIRESRGLDHQVMKMSNALSWSASSIDTDTERKATELKKRTAAKIHKKIERWYTNLTLFALTNFWFWFCLFQSIVFL